jgi:Mrp family chromosome partitioning ATPase
MAAALARKGAQVVLVDADMRMPQIHRLLGLSNELGLSTLLSGWISPRQIIDGIISPEGVPTGVSVVTEALQETAVSGLRVLTSGPQVQGTAKLIESDRFQQVIRQLTEAVDFVILDTPPIDRVGDALTVASMVDGCIFVVGAGQCEQQDISWAKHLLTNVQANLLGAVLNRYSQRRTRESEYYYYRRKRATVGA